MTAEARQQEREEIIAALQLEIDDCKKERETMEDPVEAQAIFLYIVGLTAAQRMITTRGPWSRSGPREPALPTQEKQDESHN